MSSVDKIRCKTLELFDLFYQNKVSLFLQFHHDPRDFGVAFILYHIAYIVLNKHIYEEAIT